MSNSENGFLFFYDWQAPFDCLTDKEFRDLFTAMVNYQRDGTPPPEFTGGAKIAAYFIFPQLERRKQKSDAGKAGMRSRYGEQYQDADTADDDNANSQQNFDVNNDVPAEDNVDDIAILEDDIAPCYREEISMEGDDIVEIGMETNSNEKENIPNEVEEYSSQGTKQHCQNVHVKTTKNADNKPTFGYFYDDEAAEYDDSENCVTNSVTNRNKSVTNTPLTLRQRQRQRQDEDIDVICHGIGNTHTYTREDSTCVVCLPFADGSLAVCRGNVEKYKNRYKNIDVEYELERMSGWLEHNIKLKQDSARFINGWLFAENQKAGIYAKYTNTQINADNPYNSPAWQIEQSYDDIEERFRQAIARSMGEDYADDGRAVGLGA